MTDERMKEIIEWNSKSVTQQCHNWAKTHPLLIGQCEHNHFSFCKEKSCQDVTIDDWRNQAVKALGLERLYK